MGRRKKRTTAPSRVRKKLPIIFPCPRCGRRTVKVDFGKETATVACGNCGESHQIEGVHKLMEPVDAFAEFIDMYTDEGQAFHSDFDETF